MPKNIPHGIDGVVLLDKPEGISSQSAVTIVKRSFGAAKAGHTGTLDPLATGLLPVCLGEATKYSQDLLSADKSYIATILFGSSTDTGDAEGKIISQGSVDFNVDDLPTVIAKLEGLLPKFLGEIQQVPPIYSALKRDGKPLYEYARAGEVVQIESRKVKIHTLRWISIAWPVASLEVRCSKGTYIRTLAADMGDYLGCGAHLTALRRTGVGHLDVQQAVSLEAVKNGQAQLYPIDSLLQSLPGLILDDAKAKRLSLGQRVPFSGNPLEKHVNSLFRIYRQKEDPHCFLGTAEFKAGVLHPKRLVSQASTSESNTNFSGEENTIPPTSSIH